MVRFARVAALALLVGAPFLAGCGKDDKKDDLAAYCAVGKELDAYFESSDVDFSDEDAVRGVFASDEVQDLMDRARAAAPDEIKDDLETVLDSVQAIADGEVLASEAEENTKENERLDAFDKKNCGSASDGTGDDGSTDGS